MGEMKIQRLKKSERMPRKRMECSGIFSILKYSALNMDSIAGGIMERKKKSKMQVSVTDRTTEWVSIAIRGMIHIVVIAGIMKINNIASEIPSDKLKICLHIVSVSEKHRPNVT